MADNIPNNHVIAVISGKESGETAARELQGRGFFQTHLFRGEEAAETIDARGENSGILTKVLKAAQDHLSEEPNFLAQYQEEARNGNEVIAVKADNQEQANEIKDILDRHGARNVRFFGTLAVADLTPESNPTARSEESAERQSNV